MSQYISDFWTAFLSGGRTIIYAIAAVLVLELLFRREPGFALRPRLRGAAAWTMVFIVIVAVQTAIIALMHRYSIRPLFVPRIWSWTHSGSMAVRVASWTAVFVATVGFGEFWQYWFHRLQHANKFLWRFHRVHHSIRELNGLNAADHIAQPLFSVPFILPSLMVFAIDSGPWPAILGPLGWFHLFFVHSSTTIHFGPLRYVFGDNRYHRIHHSLDRAHFGKNFASWFPIFDVIFGTACFPKPGETVATGIAGAPGPTLGMFAAIPTRERALQAEAAALAH